MNLGKQSRDVASLFFFGLDAVRIGRKLPLPLATCRFRDPVALFGRISALSLLCSTYSDAEIDRRGSSFFP